MSATPTIALPSGEVIPALGQGTWGWAERPERREGEIDALHAGIDLGMTLVDTAEMYGDGAAEELLGSALGGRRDEVFLVDKVLPQHATKQGTIDACERSLRRLRTDRIDLYLLHWRGRTPLEETLEAFAELVRSGRIRYWGVSNFDPEDMSELARTRGGEGVGTDQVLYNLTRRGVEYDLLPWCRQRELPVMAYSPIEQGRMLDSPALRQVAERHDASPAQIGLAWLLRNEGVCAIPRASSRAHVQENHAALRLRLSEQDFAELDEAFPPPTSPQPLEVL